MSKITEYRKLVRDKIPEILEAQGVKGTFHTADHEEYETELLEVVDAVIAHFAWKQEDIQAVKAHKLSERGGFSKRLILEQTEE